MKKKISFSTKGQRADIGNIVIYRMLANKYADKVGAFIFLDHIAPAFRTVPDKDGTGAHPHRGIATLTYVINGEVEHFDSRGNHEKVRSGGIQWMKAGNGITHDERLNADSGADDHLVHAFQFWINLPSKIKAEEPEYLAIQGDKVPQVNFPDDKGCLKVIVGKYQGHSSVIPNYSEQFLYHICLRSGKNITFSIDEGIEVAAFLSNSAIFLNDVEFKLGEFVEFDRVAGEITIENKTSDAADIILFGGEPYTEPIAAEGPFVMNSRSEIAEAYRDFYAGKYGTIEDTKRKL